MSVDHYAPCPCGSGKKLKFCKCVENPQDFEKIVRLIEGGQEVAAVDRINQLLAKTPNAAWLLAIKAELALGMREIDSFKETANRFLKLKPDNPLALTMKSIVCAIDQEPLPNAARFLLEGMSEARESLPAMALTAIRILLQSLAGSGMTSMVGYWADVLAALTRENGPDDNSPLIDPNLNLLAKAPAMILEDPQDAGWKERLKEVLVLSRSFRFEQAEKKLQAILRDFPGQPGPLSHLLRAQYAQLDQAGAVATARKLADHNLVSPERRAYFCALAMELESGRPGLQSAMVLKYAEIDSEDRVVESLAGLDFVEQVDGEGVEQAKQYFAYMVQDEVPAKRIFNVFDKPLKHGDTRSLASSVGTIAIFGKQTDRPTRVLFVGNLFANYQELIDRVLSAIQLGSDMPEGPPEIESSYTEFLNRPRQVIGQPLERPTIEEMGALAVEEFLNLPFNALGGSTPLEAAGDEKKRSQLLGLITHFEGEQSLVLPATTLDEIYKRLELERPRVPVDRNAETLQLKGILDLERISLADTNDQQLKGIMLRAMSLGASRVFYRAAMLVIDKAAFVSDHQTRVAALSGLIGMLPGIDEKLEYSTKLEEALIAAGAPVGQVVLQRMSLLHAAGRVQEAEKLITDAARKYPDDPYLLSFFQYAMQARGGMGPGMGGGDPLASRMMQGQARPAASESGLVLPGQEGASSQGESKLWLPGS